MKNLTSLIILLLFFQCSVKEKSSEDFNLKERLVNVRWEQDSKFHGFKQINFSVSDYSARVVLPASASEGLPWVWRARFWGHEPQTDIALLDSGYHVAYIDVAGLYGSPEAVKRWNIFYDLLTAVGLSTKPVLEGMSRGGLIVFNWLAENPERVSCVYVDAPVLDINSWPRGKGVGRGSENSWKELKRAHNFDNSEEYKYYPMQKIDEISNSGVPILLIAGDSDDVVPYVENGEPFLDEIEKKGKNEVVRIIKPGIGHHPHSLKDPNKIITFIQRYTTR